MCIKNNFKIRLFILLGRLLDNLYPLGIETSASYLIKEKVASSVDKSEPESGGRHSSVYVKPEPKS